ncbi:methyltransferase [Amycolatopsis acidicola]|uniref:methyltransferase n=1 Tax=Amycolatopsis acidicola TaxID=2596893 RepID=UPI00140C1608|nr:methyltransferase [Amycolatopsis acidicola]
MNEIASPRDVLTVLANADRIARAIHVLAGLNIADLLTGGPKTVAELASAAGADAPSLYRVLRCAACVGVFTEVRTETFALSPLAEGLRTDVTDSARDAVVMDGSEFFYRALGALDHTVRTGKTAFDHVFGMPIWPYLESNADSTGILDDAMEAINRRLGKRYLDRIDFGRFSRVADIGGGKGIFLSLLLERYPSCAGVLFERQAMVDPATSTIAANGLADRVTVVGGDFLTGPLPPGCDAYVLNMVLHDWYDEDAARILRQVRAAMGDTGGVLFLLEQVVAGLDTWDRAKLLDIDMLTVWGGRERARHEWDRLLSSAGFALANEPVAGEWTVLECVPR